MTGFCDAVHVFGIAEFLEPYSCAGFVLGLEWMNKECARFKGPKSLLGNIHFSAVLSFCLKGCNYMNCSCVFNTIVFLPWFCRKISSEFSPVPRFLQASRHSLFLPCGWKSCHFFYDLQPSHFCDLFFCFMNKSHIFMQFFWRGHLKRNQYLRNLLEGK